MTNAEDMAPISPSSLGKRSPPSRNDEENIEEPASKRQRFDTILPNTPPPEELIPKSAPVPSMFDDDARHLLQRSIALALQHVGFTGATREALEAMCSEVDTYAAHFLSKVTSVMLNSRRASPTPLDFQYGLAEFDLPMRSLEPHLHPPIQPSKYLVQLEELSLEEQIATPKDILLSKELSGEPDKTTKAYIPKRFPSFPSKHTYKWTEKESSRETDPRKIRETAAQTARQGEEALRRLTNVGKAGKEKEVRQAASKDAMSKERHRIWQQTMDDLMTGRRNPLSEDTREQDDRSSMINAEVLFYRKGISAKRKPPPMANGDAP